MLAKVNRAEPVMTGQKPGWLFVLPWSLGETGGVNQVVKSLIQRFRDGREFAPYVLITSRDHRSTVGPETDICPICLDVWSPIDVRHPARSILSFAYRWPNRYRELRRVILRDNIAVINLHFPSLNALTFLTLRKIGRLGPKIVLSFHGSDVKNLLRAAGLERLLWKAVLRRVDRIAVVSKSLAIELVELEPRIAGKLVTINSGVDLQTFAVDDRSAIPTQADHAKTIVSVGTFSSIKGHDVLVQAFSLVVKKVPNCRLVLVGKRGPELERIRDLIGALHLGQQVSIHLDVPHEHIAAFFCQARIFVLASRREGFPLVLAEAAAAKVPIVCTKVGGTSELIVDGVTGRLVDIEDPVSLADAITELLTHPQDAERIARNCYEYVKSNLTWNHAYEKYLQLVL